MWVFAHTMIETGTMVPCKEGNMVEIDIEAGTVTARGFEYRGAKIPDFLLEILDGWGYRRTPYETVGKGSVRQAVGRVLEE
ncbi:MAG: hypothetical protein U9N36_00125 [Euryarchaeota archaeon]|nr:hypothetical protein [Euryarchaeota archaeon]